MVEGGLLESARISADRGDAPWSLAATPERNAFKTREDAQERKSPAARGERQPQGKGTKRNFAKPKSRLNPWGRKETLQKCVVNNF